MSEGKQNIIRYLLENYEIQNVEDIQDALKDLLAEQSKICSKRSLMDRLRKIQKQTTLHSSYGEIPIQVPQDRNSDFDPKVVPKYGKTFRR
jgi:transposase-like protein